MDYLVDLSQKGINFAPSSEIEEIMQNVRTIVRTHVFSVPLDRDFGVDGDIVDSPVTPDHLAEVQNSIFSAIHTYEPRVEVTEISCKPDASDPSIIRPIIKVRIKEASI